MAPFDRDRINFSLFLLFYRCISLPLSPNRFTVFQLLSTQNDAVITMFDCWGYAQCTVTCNTFKIKIKIRFIFMYREIHKISPTHLTHPGWHLLNTHMHTVTHSRRLMPYTGAVGSHSQCLAQGHLGHGRRWTDTPPAVSSLIFEWQEWESNRQPSNYWTHSNH